MTRPAVLLDTCALIWIATGAPMGATALDAIVAAGNGDGILVSPFRPGKSA